MLACGRLYYLQLQGLNQCIFLLSARRPCLLYRLVYESINARFQADATMGVYSTLNGFLKKPYSAPVSQQFDPNCTYEEPGLDNGSDSTGTVLRVLPHHIRAVR